MGLRADGGDQCNRGRSEEDHAHSMENSYYKKGQKGGAKKQAMEERV